LTKQTLIQPDHDHSSELSSAPRMDHVLRLVRPILAVNRLSHNWIGQ